MTLVATTKRERKFKRAKLRLVDLTDVNVWDSDHVVALAAESAYEAASEMFAWLSVEQVRNPPRQMLDAKLARQVAIHLMNGSLGMPQRQIARLQGRQRTSIHFALQAVEKRLETDEFRNAYDRAEGLALVAFEERMGERGT